MNCCSGCESVYTPSWGRVRCANKGQRLRLLVFADETPCTSPFVAPSPLNWIDFFPVAGYRIDSSNAQIEDRKANIDVVCDRNQTIPSILNMGNKVSLIDMGNRFVLCSGKIRSLDVISETDAAINISVIKNPYGYDRIFTEDVIYQQNTPTSNINSPTNRVPTNNVGNSKILYSEDITLPATAANTDIIVRPTLIKNVVNINYIFESSIKSFIKINKSSINTVTGEITFNFSLAIATSRIVVVGNI